MKARLRSRSPLFEAKDLEFSPDTLNESISIASYCGDADCSSGIDIDDVVFLINYIFAGGNEPCDPNGDEVADC